MGIDPVTHSPRLDLLDLSTILNSSIYSNTQSQMNFSRLLGMQHPLINPDLIRLATSLLSSERRNHDFIIQNQLINGQAPTQIPPSLIQTPVQDTASDSNLMQYDDVAGFGSQWHQSNAGSILAEDYVPGTNFGYYGSDQTFQSNCTNNFSFQSVLSNMSTPSSSPTPLQSTSTNHNMNSCGTEDEREISYCSNNMFPDILDVTDFI